mmetsp:Transcript_15396/g.31285  ORF Transcript_15396/g.31285 Transcript_15396/m.31285 type:complete len:228 (+) Transcript_15396:140-823(+)
MELKVQEATSSLFPSAVVVSDESFVDCNVCRLLTKYFKHSKCPSPAAQCSAMLPCRSRVWSRARRLSGLHSSIISCTTSSFPSAAACTNGGSDARYDVVTCPLRVINFGSSSSFVVVVVVFCSAAAACCCCCSTCCTSSKTRASQACRSAWLGSQVFCSSSCCCRCSRGRCVIPCCRASRSAKRRRFRCCAFPGFFHGVCTACKCAAIPRPRAKRFTLFLLLSELPL